MLKINTKSILISALQVITVYLRDAKYSGDYKFNFVDRIKRRGRDVMLSAGKQDLSAGAQVTLYNNAEQAYESVDSISAYISEHVS